MKKSKLIIIEGSQGVGKTTITNALREKIPCTNLFRLSGVEKGTIQQTRTFMMHISILGCIEDSCKNGINYILDRSFFTEKVYCDLGYRKYDFKHSTELILNEIYKNLLELYDVHFILLTTDGTLFKERLSRDKHNYQEQDVHESIRQQKAYRNNLEHYDIKYTEVFNGYRSVDSVVEEIKNIIGEDE